MAPTNDLADFLKQAEQEIQSEYDRVSSRSSEDPGTAGDQGEENWATVLRDWLPAQYTVETKGRILGHTGDASSQIDIIVLRPGYPRGLIDRKRNLYLAGGVAAVFSCKLTLAKHI